MPKHLSRWPIAAATLLLACGAFAQTAPDAVPGYPNRPVKIIVPFGPGGPTDVMARLLAQRLSDRLGKQFYVENQGGAGSNLGMGNTARSAPDGHTMMVVSSSFVVNPSLYEKVPYDPIKDFAPVTLAASSPQVLVVNAAVPVTSVKELIDYFKANPDRRNFASPGVGTSGHLAGEMLRLSVGLDLVHVPFNGAGPTMTAMLGNHATMAFTALPPAATNIKEGKLRALAVTSAKRYASFPDVPTLAEVGFPDQESDVMAGILVPAGTPKEIVTLLQREIARVIADPETRARLDAIGFEPVANTPEEFAALIGREIPRWAKIVRDAKVPKM